MARHDARLHVGPRHMSMQRPRMATTHVHLHPRRTATHVQCRPTQHPRISTQAQNRGFLHVHRTSNVDPRSQRNASTHHHARPNHGQKSCIIVAIRGGPSTPLTGSPRMPIEHPTHLHTSPRNCPRPPIASPRNVHDVPTHLHEAPTYVQHISTCLH